MQKRLSEGRHFRQSEDNALVRPSDVLKKGESRKEGETEKGGER